MRSDVPIYAQIRTSVAKQVREGTLRSGERLPAARALADSLGINAHTVLKAYADLERDGLVEVRRGRGGVVIRKDPTLDDAVTDLVSRAKGVGLGSTDLIDKIHAAW